MERLSKEKVDLAKLFIMDMNEVMSVEAHQCLLQMDILEDEDENPKYVRELIEFYRKTSPKDLTNMFTFMLNDTNNEEHIACFALTRDALKMLVCRQ